MISKIQHDFDNLKLTRIYKIILMKKAIKVLPKPLGQLTWHVFSCGQTKY